VGDEDEGAWNLVGSEEEEEKQLPSEKKSEGYQV
jgi:hypothetical protein